MILKAFEIDDQLDKDNEICIDLTEDCRYQYINKEEAILLITHLQRVFEIQ